MAAVRPVIWSLLIRESPKMEAFFDEANFAHFFPRLRVCPANINQRFYWLNVKQLAVPSLGRRLARKKSINSAALFAQNSVAKFCD